MNQLIPLHSQTINGNAVETVSARELYSILRLDKSNWSRWSKQNIVDNQFAVENNDYVGFVIMTNGNETTDWVKDRIEKYGFEENQDYITFSQNSEKGRPSQEYFISLDMAGRSECVVAGRERGR